MGGWKLEVFKMVVYMTFPVGMFYYFNQPEFFESWMMSKRGELFRIEDKKARDDIEKCIADLQKARAQKWEEEIKKMPSTSS